MLPQILDVPIPEDCYPSKHADYAGDGVVWGLGHKQASAADCCRFDTGGMTCSAEYSPVSVHNNTASQGL